MEIKFRDEEVRAMEEFGWTEEDILNIREKRMQDKLESMWRDMKEIAAGRENQSVKFKDEELAAMEQLGWTEEDILELRERRMAGKLESMRKEKEESDTGVAEKQIKFREEELKAMEEFGWTEEDILRIRGKKLEVKLEEMRKEKAEMDAVTKEIAKAASAKFAKAIAQTGGVAVLTIFTAYVANAARKEAVESGGQLVRIVKNVISKKVAGA